MIRPAVVQSMLAASEPTAAATVVGADGGTYELHICWARLKAAEEPEDEQAGQHHSKGHHRKYP